ncbi:helix-turn-helix domain-containing protein [Verrucomicrobia bacterium S94]|nr:helix-turn-helix domain-containing protein [Verrucomicrobia bacterium S94]
MSTKPYANAEDVLPLELLQEIQKHHSGMLWIPAAESFYRQRRKLVIALKDEGISTEEIANLAGITPRRVNQILAQHKKEQAVRHIDPASGK